MKMTPSTIAAMTTRMTVETDDNEGESDDEGDDEDTGFDDL